jgi:glycopeptide antibiotics resistance protein
MDKRFWICGLAMSVATLLTGFVVHGMLLAGDYAPLVGTLLRTQEDSQHYFPWMIVADLLIGFTMTWLYRFGFSEGRTTAAQGLRFGLAVALLSVVPLHLIYYSVQPTPAVLVVKQVIFDTIRFMLLGVLIAYLQPRRAVL